MAEYVTHTLEPLYDGESRVLILGTMPSPKSRAIGFYYSHPQNRFWRVLADVFQQALPVSKEEKAAFCLRNHIALWDVLRSCAIEGAEASGSRLRTTYPHSYRRPISTPSVQRGQRPPLSINVCACLLPGFPRFHFHPPARRIAATIHTRGLLRHTPFCRVYVPKQRIE